jgi:hypothetical protein
MLASSPACSANLIRALMGIPHHPIKNGRALALAPVTVPEFKLGRALLTTVTE